MRIQPYQAMISFDSFFCKTLIVLCNCNALESGFDNVIRKSFVTICMLRRNSFMNIL